MIERTNWTDQILSKDLFEQFFWYDLNCSNRSDQFRELICSKNFCFGLGSTIHKNKTKVFYIRKCYFQQQNKFFSTRKYSLQNKRLLNRSVRGTDLFEQIYQIGTKAELLGSYKVYNLHVIYQQSLASKPMVLRFKYKLTLHFFLWSNWYNSNW